MIINFVSNNVYYDSRILRTCKALKNQKNYNKIEICGLITTSNTKTCTIEGIKTTLIGLKTKSISLKIFRILKYIEWHLIAVNRYKNQSIEVVHCHDYDTLLIGIHKTTK